MEIGIILIMFTIFYCLVAIMALLDLRTVVRSMRATTGRMIKRCDSMIAICDGAGKARRRLIKSMKGKK